MANEVAGVRVWSVTCDGTTANLSTMTKSGCTIKSSYSEIGSRICHRSRTKAKRYYSDFTFKKNTEHCNILLCVQVCYVPDDCHNIKLARNTLATSRQLKNKGF